MAFRIHRFHDSPMEAVLYKPALDLARSRGLSLYSIPVEECDALSGVIQAYVKAHVLVHCLCVGQPRAVLGECGMVAAYDGKELAGFVLYQLCESKLAACIRYCAVNTVYEGQGALRQMMAPVLERYPASFLSCSPEQVSLYEKFGFAVHEAEGCQVIMATGPAAQLGEQVSRQLEHHVLLAEPGYKAAHTSLRAKHGAVKAAQLLDALSARAAAEAERVQTYVSSAIRRRA